MDERTFLNNNIVYTFLTHFLLKVHGLLAIIITPRNTGTDAASFSDAVFTISVFVAFKKQLCFHRCKGRYFLKQTVPI